MKTYKILYFDDEQSLAKPIVENLKRKGLDIVFVSTIEDFFLKLNSQDLFDLIILDIMAPMPKENSSEIKNFSDIEINRMNNGLNIGEVLMINLRKNKVYEMTPVLFYSAKRTVNTLVGNTAYIRKPELGSDIYDKIIEMINDKTVKK